MMGDGDPLRGPSIEMNMIREALIKRLDKKNCDMI